jgi:hypothetical protein
MGLFATRLALRCKHSTGRHNHNGPRVGQRRHGKTDRNFRPVCRATTGAGLFSRQRAPAKQEERQEPRGIPAA